MSSHSKSPVFSRDRRWHDELAAENDLVMVREGWGYPGPFIKTGETKGRAFKSSLFFCVFYS